MTLHNVYDKYRTIKREKGRKAARTWCTERFVMHSLLDKVADEARSLKAKVLKGVQPSAYRKRYHAYLEETNATNGLFAQGHERYEGQPYELDLFPGATPYSLGFYNRAKCLVLGGMLNMALQTRGNMYVCCYPPKPAVCSLARDTTLSESPSLLVYGRLYRPPRSKRNTSAGISMAYSTAIPLNILSKAERDMVATCEQRAEQHLKKASKPKKRKTKSGKRQKRR